MIWVWLVKWFEKISKMNENKCLQGGCLQGGVKATCSSCCHAVGKLGIFILPDKQRPVNFTEEQNASYDFYFTWQTKTKKFYWWITHMSQYVKHISLPHASHEYACIVTKSISLYIIIIRCPVKSITYNNIIRWACIVTKSMSPILLSSSNALPNAVGMCWH